MGEQSLDEHGFPVEWRKEPPDLDLAERYSDGWNAFVSWCRRRSVRSFPATTDVVLDFLATSELAGKRLYRAWRAILERHEAFYWHTSANPIQLLKLEGLEMTTDGEVVTLSQEDVEGP